MSGLESRRSGRKQQKTEREKTPGVKESRFTLWILSCLFLRFLLSQGRVERERKRERGRERD
jgi:hypothetical protein